MRNREPFLKRLLSIEGEEFSKKILGQIISNRVIYKPQNYIDAGNMIVTNLLLFERRRIARGNDRFPKIPNRYALSYHTRTYVLSMIDEMIRQGYIEQRIGYGDKKDTGLKTLLISTEKLFQEFDKVTLEKIQLTEEIELRDKKEYFQTRSRQLDYSETDFTREMRSVVKFINDAINSVDIKLRWSENDITDKRLISTLQDTYHYTNLSRPLSINYIQSSILNSSPLEPGQIQTNIEIQNMFNGFRRIFTGGDFSLGGRYYDIGYYSYQNLSSEQRAYIFIENRPTVELDFSNMFLMMLYHKEKIDYQSDGYEIEGYKRDDVKLAVNIVFNAKNKRSATYTLRKEGVKDSKNLIIKIEKKHNRLQKYFYSRIANELMRKESDVATEILTTAINKGIISLPIHDSFIVQQNHDSIFHEIMCDVYSKRYGYRPRITSSILMKYGGENDK